MNMFVQVLNSSSIGIDNLLHISRTHFIFHPGACASHQPFSLKLIGVQQVSAQRFGVVWLIGNVRQNEDAGLVRIGLELLGSHNVVASTKIRINNDNTGVSRGQSRLLKPLSCRASQCRTETSRRSASQVQSGALSRRCISYGSGSHGRNLGYNYLCEGTPSPFANSTSTENL